MTTVLWRGNELPVTHVNAVAEFDRCIDELRAMHPKGAPPPVLRLEVREGRAGELEVYLHSALGVESEVVNLFGMYWAKDTDRFYFNSGGEQVRIQVFGMKYFLGCLGLDYRGDKRGLVCRYKVTGDWMGFISEVSDGECVNPCAQTFMRLLLSGGAMMTEVAIKFTKLLGIVSRMYDSLSVFRDGGTTELQRLTEHFPKRCEGLPDFRFFPEEFTEAVYALSCYWPDSADSERVRVSNIYEGLWSESVLVNLVRCGVDWREFPMVDITDVESYPKFLTVDECVRAREIQQRYPEVIRQYHESRDGDERHRIIRGVAQYIERLDPAYPPF